MLAPTVDVFWPIIVGTLGILILVISVIASLVLGNRRIIRAQQQKISSLKKAERIISESEKKYRTLVESMPDAAFIVNTNGYVNFANSRFLQLIKYTSEKFSKLPVLKVFPGEVNSNLRSNFDYVFSSGLNRQLEHQFDNNSKQQWFETTLVPQYDNSQTIVSILGISREITERRKLELQHMELVTTLKSQQKTLKDLSSEIIRTQEAERKRISREMHDEFGQTLIAISLNLEIINQGYSLGTEELQSKIADCKQLVQKMMQEIHRFSFELRPMILDDLGLLPAIRSHSREYSKRTGIEVNFYGSEVIDKLDNEVKTVLYRIFQEGLNNIAKHAHAHSVDISLKKDGGVISMSIMDDGVGFDHQKSTGAKPGKGGLGLQGIRERVRSVGGNFRIARRSSSGTVLTVDIPYGES